MLQAGLTVNTGWWLVGGTPIIVHTAIVSATHNLFAAAGMVGRLLNGRTKECFHCTFNHMAKICFFQLCQASQNMREFVLKNPGFWDFNPSTFLLNENFKWTTF